MTKSESAFGHTVTGKRTYPCPRCGRFVALTKDGKPYKHTVAGPHHGNPPCIERGDHA